VSNLGFEESCGMSIGIKGGFSSDIGTKEKAIL